MSHHLPPRIFFKTGWFPGHEYGGHTLATEEPHRLIVGVASIGMVEEPKRIRPLFGEEVKPAPEWEVALFEADTPEKLQEWQRRFGDSDGVDADSTVPRDDSGDEPPALSDG